MPRLRSAHPASVSGGGAGDGAVVGGGAELEVAADERVQVPGIDEAVAVDREVAEDHPPAGLLLGAVEEERRPPGREIVGNLAIVAVLREQLFELRRPVGADFNRVNWPAPAMALVILYQPFAKRAAGELNEGDLVLFVAIGGGMCWTTSLWRL